MTCSWMMLTAGAEVAWLTLKLKHACGYRAHVLPTGAEGVFPGCCY